MANRSETFDIRFKGKDQSVGRTLKGLDKDMGKFSRQAKGFAIGVAGAFAAAFAVDKLVDFGKDLFNLGRDVEVWGVKVDTVFGTQADSVRQWADSVNESMGISDERVAGLAASMGDLLVPLGATRKEAAQMSQSLVGLSPALATWSGGMYDAAAVSDILTKALLGERESLKSLGISMSQAEVDTRALELAKKEQRTEITKLDQARATEQLILEKSTDAQNAWTDGSFEQVKALNSLKANWEDLQVTLAAWLIPEVDRGIVWLVETAIPALQGFFFNPQPTFDMEFGTGILPEPEEGTGIKWIEKFKELWGELDDLVSDSGGIESMWEPFTNADSSLRKLIDSMLQFNPVLIAGNALAWGAEEAWGALVIAGDFLWGVLQRITPAFILFNSVVGAGKAIWGGIESIWRGIGSGFQFAKDRFNDLKDALKGGLPSINIPSFSGGGSDGKWWTPWAAGGYITQPTAGIVGEGSMNEFVINAAQMRGLAREGISVGDNSNQGNVVVNVQGSILSENDLAGLISRLTSDGRVGTGLALGV